MVDIDKLIQEADEAVMERVREYVGKVADAYKSLLANKAVQRKNGAYTRNTTGKLSDSVDVDSAIEGDALVGKIYLEDYWEVLDYKRSWSKMPPAEPIYEWAKAKGLLSTEQLPTNSRSLPTNSGTLPTKRERHYPYPSLVYLIQKKIKNEGLYVEPFMQEAVDMCRDDFDALQTYIANEVGARVLVGFEDLFAEYLHMRFG